jgi:hypothetical protein
MSKTKVGAVILGIGIVLSAIGHGLVATPSANLQSIGTLLIGIGSTIAIWGGRDAVTKAVKEIAAKIASK